MDSIDKLYYINLDRRPNRNAHVLNQLVSHNIPASKVNRVAAIDGSTYRFNISELDMFKNADYRGEPWERNIMGNQLSHYYILQHIIANNYKYAIVCQDDVVFRDDFCDALNTIMSDIPEDAELINIGMHKSACFHEFISWDFTKTLDDINGVKTIVNEHLCKMDESINPCSLAYIVTQQGAKNMVAFFNRIGFLRATDWNFNDYLTNKNIFYGSRTVLCTGNSNLPSDIFICRDR